MDVAFGVLAVAMSLFALATALVPRWRGAVRWRGSQVRTGVISSLGFAMVFGGAALLFLTRGAVSDHYRAWIVVLLIAGVPAVLIGQWIDFR
jgi:hypothetical protein